MDIDDLTPRPLSMSGIVLTAEQAGVIPAPKPDAQGQTLLQGTPITARTFDASDRLTAAVEIYEATDTRRPGGNRAVTASVVSPDGRALVSQNARALNAGPKSEPGTTAYQAVIPLRGFAKGAYTLRFEIASGGSAAALARREVRIEVK